MKKYTAILMIILMVSLTGCASSSVVLTEDENDMIAEYMAGVLLKHDKHYSEKLISIESPETSESPEESPEASPEASVEPSILPENTDPSSSPVVSTSPEPDSATVEPTADLAVLYTDHSFKFSYKGYEIYESYPKASESTDFSLEAKKGNKLLVVSFQIENVTKEKKKLSLTNSELVYNLNVDDAATYSAEITPLLNDIQFLELNIEGESTTEAVVVFEVDQELEQNKLILNISNSNDTVEIKLK